MSPHWTDSTRNHRIPRSDQVYVIRFPNYVAVNPDGPPARGQITLFIGHPHAQTEREVEILVHEFPDTGEAAVIFHAMPLGPKFRRYREEHPDG